MTERKRCILCAELSMTNQSFDPANDSNSIGKWSDWQGNLNARIMLIGQDWGTVEYWHKNKGRDSETNPSNITLKRLFSELDFNLGSIANPSHKEPLFFTNSVLCLKQGRMSDSISSRCYQNCGTKFLKPLIDLVNPEIIIALGRAPFASVMNLYKPEGFPKVPRQKDIVRAEPILIGEHNIKLFPVYHCGPLGRANRKFNEQVLDWMNIKKWI